MWQLFAVVKAIMRGTLAGIATLSCPAAHASGPYIVDDAGITPAGRAQIEAWLSHTRGTATTNVVPAVTFSSLPQVEWSVAFNGTRPRDVGDDRFTVQAKRQFRSADHGGVGIAAAGNVVLDARSIRPAGGFVYGAVTVPVSDRVLIHGNTGVGIESAGPATVTASWGVRSEVALEPDRLAAHVEVFGTTATGASFQAGLRPTIARGNVDLEFAFAHNLAGERRHWLTLGLTSRF